MRYSAVSRRTFVKGAAILAGTSALVVRGHAANASTPAAVRRRAAAPLSNLSWSSGCWNGNDAPSEATAFGDWRSNPVDVAVAWPDLGSWTSYTTQPNSIYSAFSGAPFPIVWGISPIPFDGGASTMAECAAGAYNDHWTDFANTLVAYGLQNSIIRLGWELNGDWYPWGGDPDFVAAWQQIVDTVRPIAPGLQWNWNPNAGSNNGFPGDAVLGAYPGDTYVDMIGVDSYDKGGATLDQMLNGDYGLQYWLNFAVAHGKTLSVPEWGLWTSSNQGHDDDPDYIAMMHDFFANNASNIAFEAYFNDAEASIGSSLYNPDLYPHSSAVYQNLWTGSATRIIDDYHPAVSYSGAWTPTYLPQYLPDRIDFSETYSNTANSYAELAFVGTGVTWIGNTYTNRGLADVYIDGVLQATVDCYAATWTSQVALYGTTGLSDSTHVIRVVVTGQKNPSATDCIIVIDAFTGPDIVPAAP